MKKDISISLNGLIAENGLIIRDGHAILRYTSRRDNTILTEDNGYECRCTYHIILNNGHKLPGHPFISLTELLQYVINHPNIINS